MKVEVVRLALTSTQHIAKTASDIGIKLPSLYCWVDADKDKARAISDEHGDKAKLVNESNRLRKENTHLKEERELLKNGRSVLCQRNQVKF